MLTTSGYRWLLVLGFFWLAGLLAGAEATVVAWPALTLLLAFAAAGLRFAWQVHRLEAELRLECCLQQAGREVAVLWAGVSFELVWELTWRRRRGRLLVLVRPRVSPGPQLVDGQPMLANWLVAKEPLRLEQRYVMGVPGAVRLEGVQLDCYDPQGWFHYRLMIRWGQEAAVLPPLTDEQARQRALKAFNQLPPPGVHRLRRAGIGSELLDLRDYRPGDPPKMIAWKVSARRDQLITKEFESEVPVRCWLVVDGGRSLRRGEPGQTPVQQVAAVAGAVAQAALAQRDYVGLAAWDGQGCELVRPARTRQHLLQLLHRLAWLSARPAPPRGLPLTKLVSRTHRLAQELYPQLFHSAVNALPLGRLWRPVLDRWWGWLLLGVIAANCAAVWFIPAWRQAGLQLAAQWTLQVAGEAAWGWRLAVFAAMGFGLLHLPALVAAAVWLVSGGRDLFGRRRRERLQRKQLAALWAMQDGDGPAWIERYMHDDAAFVARAERFWQEHYQPPPQPAGTGWTLQEPSDKVAALAAVLVQAVGYARDNELYVLFVDLLEGSPELAPLIRACHMVRARHHQVLVVVPLGEEPQRMPLRAGRPADQAMLQELWGYWQQQSLQRVRQEFAAIGVSVLPLQAGETVQAVLQRLDQLRGYRCRR